MLLTHFHGLAGLSAQVGVDSVPYGLLVLFGDTQQHANDPHGHLRAEVGDEVELLGTDQRIEALSAELADLRFERGHPVRGEDPGHQPSVDGVYRRILEDEHP